MRVAGKPIRVGGRKAEKTLGALAVDTDNTVSFTQLVDVLWDEEPPSSAVRQVQNAVSALRRSLMRSGVPDANDVIMTVGRGYRLNQDKVAVDLDISRRWAAKARTALAAGDLAGAADHFRQTIDLARGPALAGIGSHVLAAASLRLDEQRLSACEQWADVELRLGRNREVVGELTTLVSEHPLRERFVAQLMLALYRAGRAAEALNAYRRLRNELADEIGLDPGRDLQDLHSAILRGDAGRRPEAAAAGRG
jgi:DNA-binding SARP family transcriptional activator